MSEIYTKHCLRQLGRSTIADNSVDDRFTYASAPKWTDASMFCHLPDECDRNADDLSIHTHQLYKLEQSVSLDRRYCHTKAA